MVPRPPFDPGFNTRCENMAELIRRDLRRLPSDPLTATDLASYLGVQIVPASDVPGMSEASLRVLLDDEPDDWSTLAITSPGANLVIYNPTHWFVRGSSDIVHELAHLLLRHSPATLVYWPAGDWTLRFYDEHRENEAARLSACLLLPRPALVHITRSRMRFTDATTHYGVSAQLLWSRMNSSGVRRDLRKSRGSNTGLPAEVASPGAPPRWQSGNPSPLAGC